MPGIPGVTSELESLLSELGIALSPAVLAGILVALVLVVVGVAWRFVRRRRRPSNRFVRTIDDLDAVEILLHPNPDPDAMAAGFAVQAICEASGVAGRIVYPGQLRHHENRAFRTVLEMDLDRVETASDIADRPIVLVDHGVPRGFPGASSLDPVAVIDHHDEPPVDAEFVDVRPDYGACATILVEYLRNLGAGRDDGRLELTDSLATALVYGIHTDTNNLTRGATHREFDAVRYLYHRVDTSKLERIANPSVEGSVLDSKAQAITRREVRDCYCVSDMGPVQSADTVPMAAEELLRLEGVTSAVALGEYDGTIVLSGRTIDDRVHMGEALEAATEKVPGANAGGHARMGGGQIPLDAMEGIGPTTGLTRKGLIEAIFSSLREGE